MKNIFCKTYKKMVEKVEELKPGECIILDEIKDNHTKECVECGLKTDFISKGGKCELCEDLSTKAKEDTLKRTAEGNIQ